MSLAPSIEPAPFTDARLEALKLYRLEEGLSFDSLATRMQRAGFAVRMRALHYALTNRVRTRPRETTLFKIGRFMEAVRAKATTTKKPRRHATGPKRKKPTTRRRASV